MPSWRQGCFILVLASLFLLFSAVGSAGKPMGGIGLAVVPTAGGELVVLSVVDGAPAAAAGMQPGDLLIQVNDFPLHGSDFAEVTSRHLWGEIGAPVTLRYLRPGVAGAHSVTLKRVPLDPGTSETR